MRLQHLNGDFFAQHRSLEIKTKEIRSREKVIKLSRRFSYTHIYFSTTISMDFFFVVDVFHI